MKPVPLVISLALFAAAACVLFAGGRSPLRSNVSRETEELVSLSLNDTLTNSLSDIEELKGLDDAVQSYMAKWLLKGTSLAVMRNDSLLYAKGYGICDDNTQMQPYNILRMASVSKLVTAVGIMTLVDRGELSLDERIFGPGGLLGQTSLNNYIKDTVYYKVTVEHLLRHQGGFRLDPAFSSLDVKHQLQLSQAPALEEFARVTLGRPHLFVPGTRKDYSNFGYMLLSRVIEEVTGQDYEQWMCSEVLSKAGCNDFHIAHNYYKDRYPGEVRYYTHSGDGKYIEDYHGNGRTVERCYGGNDIRALSGAGAWVASVPELMKLIASIDGRPEVPDIISAESVAAMTAYVDENTYSLGWNETDPMKGWTRTGSYSGTSALVHYYPGGECWIIINNTSTWKGPSFSRYTEALMKDCRTKYSSRLPQRNLFY